MCLAKVETRLHVVPDGYWPTWLAEGSLAMLYIQSGRETRKCSCIIIEGLKFFIKTWTVVSTGTCRACSTSCSEWGTRVLVEGHGGAGPLNRMWSTLMLDHERHQAVGHGGAGSTGSDVGHTDAGPRVMSSSGARKCWLRGTEVLDH